VLDLVVLFINQTLIFLLEVYAKLVVDERNDHAVVERDQIGGLVLSDLVHGLHEHEGSVGGKLILSLFSDEPSLLRLVTNLGMIGGDSLQFYLDHAFHGATDGVIGLFG